MNKTKVTPELDDEEIARRLAAGESQTELAKELGVSRTTIQRHARAGQARIDEANAEAARAEEDARRVREERDRHVVSFDSRGRDAIFFDAEQREQYYGARRLQSNADYCAYNSVCRGLVLRRERRAIEAGRKLYRHPPGTEPWLQAA